MAGRFWENEQPEVVEGRYVTWQFYPKARVLQITQIKTDQYGIEKRRTISIGRQDLTDDVMDLLEKFLNS
jgi:hypothetical protein